MGVTATQTLEIDRDRDAEAFDPEHCSVRGALEVFGVRSSLLLLREAFYGTRRFDDFARRAGITEQVAATRLKALVDDGLLRREPYREPGQRTRSAYRLTPKGRDLYPVLVSLMQWGDRYNPGPDGPSIRLIHRECGEPIAAEVRCAAGHQVDVRDVAVVAGAP